jgi:hypothetical protein
MLVLPRRSNFPVFVRATVKGQLILSTLPLAFLLVSFLPMDSYYVSTSSLESMLPDGIMRSHLNLIAS